jgi:hypothetical protein
MEVQSNRDFLPWSLENPSVMIFWGDNQRTDVIILYARALAVMAFPPVSSLAFLGAIEDGSAGGTLFR